jgi:Pvc16 N-terminal domain
MSTDLAITAVTRTLRQILDDEVADKWGVGVLEGDLTKQFVVANLPPHKVRDLHPSQNVVNVFLYRTDLNAGWRNMTLPSQTKPGESGPPPLALNLEYLVTAYGEDDREDAAHFFLGQAMRVLHDRGVLPRAAFKTVLPAALVHLQIEQVTITPKPLSIEEMSKLWSIFQTQYRICAAYLVTVLLIDSRTATKSAPPVLTRGPEDRGFTAIAAPPPVLDFTRPATGFAAVRLGEELVIHGERFDVAGDLTARLRHPMLAEPLELPVTPVDATHVKIALPGATGGSGVAAAWPSGFYRLALVVARPNIPPWPTNEVSFALAPSITVDPVTNTNPGSDFTVTLEATPQVREDQPVLAIFGSTQFTPSSVSTPNDPDAPTTITFDAPGDLGVHRVRLRVDGVDSIPIVKSGETMTFDPAQSVEVKNP